MADIFRRIKILFDRDSARKAQDQLVQTMQTGGAKAGQAFVRELKQAFDKRIAELKVALARGLIDQKEFKKQADLAAKTFNAGIVKGMREAQRAGTLTDKEFIKLSRTLKRTGDEGVLSGSRMQTAFARLGATIAATFTVDAAIRFFRRSVEAALEAEESTTRLNAVLKPLGLSYTRVAKQVEGYLDRLQETTKFSDEDAREALTVLVTATGDYEKSLRLLDVTAKIAEKRQTTMAEAAKVAADASKGVTRGMRDLGIATGETGDIVQKISIALGNIAEEAGGTNAGKIKRAANLWDEFQEKIGLAVLGSDAFQDSSGGLIARLIDMNKWVDKNNQSISSTVDTIARLVTGLFKLSNWIINHTPNLVTLGRLIDKIRGRDGEPEQPIHEDLAESVPGLPSPQRVRPPVSGQATRTSREDRRAERDRAGLEHDIRVASFMLEEQATREFAEAEVRKLEMLGQSSKVAFGTLEDGFKKLQQLNLMLQVAGFDKTLIPQVQRTAHTIQDLIPPAVETMAAGMEKVAKAAEVWATQFSTPWIDAMGIIRNEVEGQGTLFLELGEAWAQGGFAGIAELAKAKIKENLAWVIENTAKALGSLGLGNPKAAADHFAAAAKHGLAAIAWKGVAATAGGGGSAGSSAGGSAGRGSATSASNLERPESQISIYLTGPGWHALNPEVQRVVAQAGEMARERHGANTKVRVIRGSR